ncbi:hypothetical protein ABLN72_13445 [Mycobacterium tuberculosis]
MFNLQASQHFTVFAFIVKAFAFFARRFIPTLPLFSHLSAETLSRFRAPLRTSGPGR